MTIPSRISNIRAHTFTISTSREGGALVFDDFLKYIMENSLRIVGVANLRTDTQYVAAFFDVVLYVVISTFVRKLSHFDFLISELLVQIV